MDHLSGFKKQNPQMGSAVNDPAKWGLAQTVRN